MIFPLTPVAENQASKLSFGKKDDVGAASNSRAPRGIMRNT